MMKPRCNYQIGLSLVALSEGRAHSITNLTDPGSPGGGGGELDRASRLDQRRADGRA